MQAFVPHKFLTGEMLSPTKINENFRQIIADLADQESQKYIYSTVILDFSGTAAADDNAIKKMAMSFPVDVEIIGAELYCADDVAQSLTLSSTASGWENVTLTYSASSLSGTIKQQSVRVAASTSTEFSVSGHTGTVSTLYVVLHLRSNRTVNGPTAIGTANLPFIGSASIVPAQSGDLALKAPLDQDWAYIEDFSDVLVGNTRDIRVSVFSRRQFAAAGSFSYRLPAEGRTVAKVEGYAVADVGTTARVRLYDENGVAVATLTMAGAGASTVVTSSSTPTQAQPADEGYVDASDWYCEIDRSAGAGTVYLCYIVVHWLAS